MTSSHELVAILYFFATIFFETLQVTIAPNFKGEKWLYLKLWGLKSNFKNLRSCSFWKFLVILPTLAPTCKIFTKSCLLIFRYSCCILSYLRKAEKRSWKSFFNTHNLNFRDTPILAVFCIILHKSWHSDVIICIAAILIFFQFFLTWQSMTVPDFMSKAGSYQDLGRGHYGPPLGHDKTKIPRGS